MTPSHLFSTIFPLLPSPYPSGLPLQLIEPLLGVQIPTTMCMVRLNKDGTMVLMDYDGTVVWQTNTRSKGVDYAELMDSGNLVMKDQGGNILWQSFDHPTNMLLPTQPVTASTEKSLHNPQTI